MGGTGKDATYLKAPSDYGRSQCYKTAFANTLRGQNAFVFVEGAKGRLALVDYIVAHTTLRPKAVHCKAWLTCDMAYGRPC